MHLVFFIHECDKNYNETSSMMIVPLCRILAWEDGYSDHPKPIQGLESAPADIYFNETKKIISICNTSVHDTVSSGYTLELAMAEMSSLQYALGEGYSKLP